MECHKRVGKGVWVTGFACVVVVVYLCLIKMEKSQEWLCQITTWAENTS